MVWRMECERRMIYHLRIGHSTEISLTTKCSYIIKICLLILLSANKDLLSLEFFLGNMFKYLYGYTLISF